MSKTIPADESKAITDHAIQFERRLISIYVAEALPPASVLAIETGAYKHELATGRKPLGPYCPDCGQKLMPEGNQLYCVNQYCENMTAFNFVGETTP